MKFIKTCIFLAHLFVINQTSAFNLFEVESISGNSRSFHVLDSRLFYLDNDSYLSRYIDLKQGSQPVLKDGHKVKIKQLVFFENELYIIDDSNSNLLKFNGEDFSIVSAYSFSHLTVVDNTLLGSTTDTNSILMIKNDQINVYEINESVSLSDNKIYSLCKFSDEHFVFFTKDYYNYSNQYQHHEYKSGEINSNFYGNNAGILNTLYSIPELGCVIYGSNYSYLKFEVIDSKLNRKDLLDLDYIYYQNLYLDSDEKLLAIASHESKYKLFSIQVPSLDYEVLTEFNPVHYISKGMYKFGSLIYMFSGGSSCDIPVPSTKCSPGSTPIPNYLAVLDTVNGKYKTIDGAFNVKNSYIRPDLKILSSSDNGNELLVLDSNDEITTRVKYKDLIYYKVVGQNESNEFFVVATDLITRDKKILLLTEKAYVSQHLDGLWYSSEWNNQGLTIQVGTRKDSADYLFIGAFLFKEGKPFWMTGSTNLGSLVEDIEIELFEFEGGSFLPGESGYNDITKSYGTMKIIPQSCNSILLEINGSDSNNDVSIMMVRIPNKNVESICLDRK